MPYIDWLGKKDVVNHHKKIPYKTIECKEEIGELNSSNMIIKGDNLLALKSLLPYYASSVKMIYIDPPYNTGNTTWVYNDNMDSPIIKKWLKNTVNAEDLSRSDKWLCMMYPRLKLLRELLKDDGVIFISIDDAEVAHLRMICDEIFGSENFISIIQWRRSESQNNNAKQLSKVGEFIICYGKQNKEKIIFNNINLTDKATKEYRYKDEIDNFRRGTIIDNSRGKNLLKVTSPKGITTEIKSIRNMDWFIEKETQNLIYWTDNGTPYLKLYLKDSEGQKASNWFDNVGVNEDASETLSNLNIKFDFSKPYQLIQHIIKLATSKDDIILDSFAGSGTTAHAVLEQNALDGGNRKFILVETMDYAKDITAERVKRVVEGYSFTGKDKTTLFEKKLSTTDILNSKKMQDLSNEVKTIVEENSSNFDKIEKSFKENSLKIEGIKDIKGFKKGLGGGFKYCELGDDIFDEFGELNKNLDFFQIAKHIYFVEFKKPILKEEIKEPFVWKLDEKFIYFYNKNFTNRDLKLLLKEHLPYKEIVIYTKKSTISKEELKSININIRFIPYDIKEN